jgi:hypothetical protein
MAELSLAPAPERGQLLGQLGARLGDLDPSLRVVARDLLAAETSIDFVAVDSGGRVVLVLVGEPRGDLALVARGLAQRAWVEPRLGDWLQLAPNLGIRPEAGVRVVLLSADYGPDSRAAAGAAGATALELATYRCVRNGAWAGALVEWLGTQPEATLRPTALPIPSPSPPRSEPAASPGAASPPSAVFRTGLSEEDLGLSTTERADFE